MQKLKKNRKIIIGVLIGIIMSSTISYVIASTLINSKDVIYEDNSNLMADNVQEAIDGTCSKIDTRLSDIEDKLYIIKNIETSKSYTSSTTPIYSGVSITFPANSYCSINITSVHHTGSPIGVFLSEDKEKYNVGILTTGYHDSSNLVGDSLYIPYSAYFEKETTYYVWTVHKTVGLGVIRVKGFCATKYKLQ